MGFFNSQKEGKGVEKREYIPRPSLYFELIFRKAWLMVKANFAYLITSILAIVFIWFGYNTFAQGMLATLKGAAFLTRYFARQRHVWIFSDFYEQVWVNFKKGFALFVVDSLLIYLSTVAFSMYGQLALENKFMLVPLGFMAICLLVYFMMHFYMYPIMVTFDLDMKYILKDSLLLTLAHLPWNLFITFIITAIPFVLYVINIPLTAIFMLVIGVAFLNFTVNFMVDPIIDKHLYIPAEVIAENEADEYE